MLSRGNIKIIYKPLRANYPYIPSISVILVLTLQTESMRWRSLMNFIIFASVCHAAQTTIFGLIGRTVLPHHPTQGTHIRQPRRPLPHGTLRTARLRLLQPPHRPHPPRRTGPRQRYSPSYAAYGHHQEYHLYVHDPCIGDFRFLAYYPPQHPITLGEQFLQADTLLFQVRSTPLPLSSSDD